MKIVKGSKELWGIFHNKRATSCAGIKIHIKLIKKKNYQDDCVRLITDKVKIDMLTQIFSNSLSE